MYYLRPGAQIRDHYLLAFTQELYKTQFLLLSLIGSLVITVIKFVMIDFTALQFTL